MCEYVGLFCGYTGLLYGYTGLFPCMCEAKSMAVDFGSNVKFCQKSAGLLVQSHSCERGGGLGSSTISKNLMSPTPRRKWYLTTGRRAY